MININSDCLEHMSGFIDYMLLYWNSLRYIPKCFCNLPQSIEKHPHAFKSWAFWSFDIWSDSDIDFLGQVFEKLFIPHHWRLFSFEDFWSTAFAELVVNDKYSVLLYENVHSNYHGPDWLSDSSLVVWMACVELCFGQRTPE